MKKLISILIGIVSVVGVQAQDMKALFVSMPDSIAPLLTKVNREDCIDFLASNMKAEVKNRFGQPTELKKLTDDYLYLQTTSKSSMEMKLLPLNDSVKIVCMVNTVCASACDSEIRFFSAQWQELPKQDYMKLPSVEAFYLPVDSLKEDFLLLREKADMELLKATLSPDSAVLSIAYTTPDYLAKERDEALDHVLFYGPPGLGKTTLAGIIANEMGVNLKVTSGPAIEKPGEMAAILNNLQEHDVLFVDEIHRLNRQVEEVLYPAMEDYAIDIMIGKGATARSIRLDLPKFTLVGATTRAGMLTAPLRDRFGVVNRLEFYTEEELMTIIKRSARVLNVEIDTKGALELAKRSRGTPRLANRLLKRVRDFAQVKYDGVITEEVANYALDLLDVDRYGLDHGDRMILQVMIEKFQGGPVGLDTLAASISEDSGTLEDVYEPYLLKCGFIQRTPRGRVVTDLAYRHLGILPPVSR